MRKRISTKDNSFEITILIVGVILAIRLRFIFSPYPGSNLLYGLIGIVTVWGAVYMMKNKTVIEFDTDYIYLSRGKNGIMLPLSHVNTIKLTMTRINAGRVWKLKYTDMDNKKFAARILPSNNGNFEAFVEQVKKANPQLIYQPYSSSVDFDQ